MGTRKRGAELFIEMHGLERECQCCHNKEWNGNKIPLEIHHIDGNKKNNDAENIMILCPNCHYFTDNYKAKNRKKNLAKDYFCSECGKKLYEETKSGLCKECFGKKEQEESKCNNKEYISELMRKFGSYSKVAKIVGVSDKTIAKWCERFGIVKS